MQNPPILLRVFGYYHVKTEKRCGTRLQNLFLVAGILAYFDGEDGFYIKAHDKTKLFDAAKKDRLTVTVSKLLGLPQYIYKKRYRVGVPIGVALATFILFCGINTVWRVDITGNEKISSAVITEELSKLGFGIGSDAKRENYDDIITAYRLQHPEIAWMGIYTEGTTAYVRVIENNLKTSSSNEDAVAHLIATEDAVIERLDVLHGTAVVKAGSVVKKGDALVLGVIPGAHYDTLLAAEGEVIGRVAKSFAVEIPYAKTEKTEKKRKKMEVALIFFEKTINIFKNSSKSPMDYVIIERKEEMTLGNRTLPFGLLIREALYYEEYETVLSKGEAILEGMALLEGEVRTAVGEGELLSRSVRVEEREGSCVLYATIEFTKNIAERLPFAVD